MAAALHIYNLILKVFLHPTINMSILFTKYMSLLEKRPLITKCTTSAVLVALGDTICQTIEKSKYTTKNKS